ncbi:MAG: regulatory iron-sulfur-containing complex subunit RicT [Prevotellamassilia sp.]|nr:regulatory iron-sulfur-containing complex subunit RicT [Prevotellamassilia sp.]
MNEQANPHITPSCCQEGGACCHEGACDACAWGDRALQGFCAKGCGRSDRQLNTYDYLNGVPGNLEATDFVEVQFKNTRKDFYRNDNHLDLQKGDVVAVEAHPGHDIGVVTLTGRLVLLQMQKATLRPGTEIKRVYRKARPNDMEKYAEAKAREHETMIRSRQIAKELQLDMKIGDVEYQGDGNKAIFYYIADQRVDFRKLIKVLADAFHVRIEMKQIGARQEAGRIGGIGPCGRELCCATWMKNFNSVSTGAARFQDITPNPQKLAGQCAKLKCCLNYEVDTYMEAARALPERNVTLETMDGTFYFFKADTLAGLVTYSTDRRLAANLVTITAQRAREIIAMNRDGEKPEALSETEQAETKTHVDLAEQDDLTRFDKARGSRRRGRGRGEGQQTRQRRERGDNGGAPQPRQRQPRRPKQQ